MRSRHESNESCEEAMRVEVDVGGACAGRMPKRVREIGAPAVVGG